MSAAAHFILYVADQSRSTQFYAAVLGIAPRLNVPGMTEFILPNGAVLGLMPEAAIERLLGSELPSPSTARGVPRAELYLVIPEAASYHARALSAGAKELSSLSVRSWGHLAAYCLDPDGHVLAFAIDGATGVA
jgi:catechol 2,3-dioxygenase-like lactoylglutathione lyase family enzyme